MKLIKLLKRFSPLSNVVDTLYFVEELGEAAVEGDAIKSSEFTTTQPNCPLKARGSQKDGK